jgi:CHASE3 domain sensor protein
MALVLLTTLLALCIAAGIYAAVDLYNSAENRYVNQALPLRTATRDLVLQMVNEETGVRGYMISRRRDQLRPFFNGTLGVHQDLGTISRLSRDNPTLRRRTVLLRREITSVESWLKRQITFVGDSVAGQKRAQMDLPQGQAYFNRFRSTASLLNGDVDRLVAATRERQRRTFVGTLVALIAAGVGALLISLTLLRRFPEQVRQSYAQEEEGRLRAEQQANAARALAHIQDASCSSTTRAGSSSGIRPRRRSSASRPRTSSNGPPRRWSPSSTRSRPPPATGDWWCRCRSTAPTAGSRRRRRRSTADASSPCAT